MRLLSFKCKGRFGHFLRAEGGVSALSYPVPPRTVILGVIGAVLGLEKDQAPLVLEPAHIALAGRLPQTHWHTAKFRQDADRVERLPWSIDAKQRGSKPKAIDLPKIISQEWLFNPSYQIWCALPNDYHDGLEGRIRERRWHFQPYFGISEMPIDLSYLGSVQARPVIEGAFFTRCVFPEEHAILDMEKIFEAELVLHSLRMPRQVTPDRVFSHASYYMERDGRPVPIHTENALQTEEGEVLLLL